jgi:hypothetical protein
MQGSNNQMKANSQEFWVTSAPTASFYIQHCHQERAQLKNEATDDGNIYRTSVAVLLDRQLIVIQAP